MAPRITRAELEEENSSLRNALEQAAELIDSALNGEVEEEEEEEE